VIDPDTIEKMGCPKLAQAIRDLADGKHPICMDCVITEHDYLCKAFMDIDRFFRGINLGTLDRADAQRICGITEEP
jgi:hypothetical protein